MIARIGIRGLEDKGVIHGSNRNVTAVLIARGEIPCVRRDRRVLLDRQDLDHWLELGKTSV